MLTPEIEKLLAARAGLSVAEVAELTSLSKGEVRNLLGDGRLSARRSGRRVLIEPPSVAAWLATLPAYEPAKAAA